MAKEHENLNSNKQRNKTANNVDGEHPNPTSLQITNEVGALLSADMKDEKYYDQKLQEGKQEISQSMASPRYRGFVAQNMEMERYPKTGPIGLPDVRAKSKHQTLTGGRPVRPLDELDGTKDKLMYLGEQTEQKSEDHANFARARVQRKTSAEMDKMQRAHNDMNNYLTQYNKEKDFKGHQRETERRDDMIQLRTYNPFGKPGGGAPIQSKSGRNLPGLAADTEIRFRDNEYHKKMIERGKRYRNPLSVQHEYNVDLDKQVEEKTRSKRVQFEENRKQEVEAMRYDPFGKPGGGAPRNLDKSRHWSKLEPLESKSSLTDKRHRLKLQARENLAQSDENRKSKMKKHKHMEVYNPWGKGSGNPRYDERGNVSVRFGMKTRYDIFNKSPIIQTPSKHTLGGWPLPLEGDETGDGLHTSTENKLNSPRETHRSGLLSRRHGQNFVTEAFEDRPPLLNGKEALLTDGAIDCDVVRKKPGVLKKIHGQSMLGPLTMTGNDQLEGKSVGRLKRELDENNRQLAFMVNDIADTYQPPVKQSESSESTKSKSSAETSSRAASSTLPSRQRSTRESIRNHQHDNKDIADWMRSSAVGQPQRDENSLLIKPTRRVTSDVTRHRLDLRTPKNPRTYHQELSEQVHERKAQEKLFRESEKRESENWDEHLMYNFGRPGGGAPTGRGAARRQFSNPSLVPQKQLGTGIPTFKGEDNINEHIGGAGHGAPHEKGTGRRIFSNAALVPQTQPGTNIPKIVGDKATTVKSLLNTIHLENQANTEHNNKITLRTARQLADKIGSRNHNNSMVSSSTNGGNVSKTSSNNLSTSSSLNPASYYRPVAPWANTC